MASLTLLCPPHHYTNLNQELEIFHEREAALASSDLEEINRERSESIVSASDFQEMATAAERVLRSPWTSMDEGPVNIRPGHRVPSTLPNCPIDLPFDASTDLLLSEGLLSSVSEPI